MHGSEEYPLLRMKVLSSQNAVRSALPHVITDAHSNHIITYDTFRLNPDSGKQEDIMAEMEASAHNLEVTGVKFNLPTSWLPSRGEVLGVGKGPSRRSEEKGVEGRGGERHEEREGGGKHTQGERMLPAIGHFVSISRILLLLLLQKCLGPKSQRVEL